MDLLRIFVKFEQVSDAYSRFKKLNTQKDQDEDGDWGPNPGLQTKISSHSNCSFNSSQECKPEQFRSTKPSHLHDKNSFFPKGSVALPSVVFSDFKSFHFV